MATTIDSDLWLVGGGEMGDLIRSRDWTRSPIGPIGTWPQSLRTALGICLSSRFPMAIWWGPEILQFYNDGYRPFLGTKHPRSMGQRGDECWAEIWDVCGPLYRHVMATGESTWSADLLLLMERNGYVEETYFTFSYSPIRGEAAEVLGNLITVTETTERVIGERRLRTLRDIGALAMTGKTPDDAARLVTQTLGENRADVPFSLVYAVDETRREARLVSTSALAPGTAASPLSVDIVGEGTVWPLGHVMQSMEPVVIDKLDLPGGLPSEPWNEVPRTAIALPLVSGDAVTGVLVTGVSARRALDDAYRSFHDVLASQIATVLANARAQDEQRRRAEALAELDRAKTEFFSNVSHEFRTPLTLMLGPLEDALRGAALPDAEREQLRIAHRNGLRLLKLVNTLLDFSRIEAGRADAVYEPLDVSQATAEMAATFRSAVERAGLRLVVDCAPLREPVWVDRDLWEKVVLNLLSNALKFTFDGEIGVRVRDGDDRVVLTVSDTGIGIAGDDLERIFDRFHRVRGAHSRTHEGTGIGLSLVRELVKLHGGEIEVASALGAGTTFTVVIPRGREHLPPDRVGGTRAHPSTAIRAEAFIEESTRWLAAMPARGVERSTTPYDTAGARVLIAEDNADMQQYMHRLLAPHWNVEIVRDGADALDRALASPPELIISDVMMPRVDGRELLRRLRANPRTAAIPIVLLSARAGEESRVEGLDAGADDYLVKPFAARELLVRVNTHLVLARLRREIVNREQAARRAAEAANHAKDEFLAMLAHELRNPLAVVLNGVNILERVGSPAPEGVRVRSLMRRQIDHLSRLLDDLLDVARISQGKIELRQEPLDFRAIVDFAVESERHRTAARHQHVEVTMPAEPLLVSGDAARLRQVIVNLLHNASKYTPPHGRIAVIIRTEGDEVVLRIRDTGIGIAPEKLPSVFDLFVQLDASLDRSQGGLGIGLTLVRRLVEQHGGRVEAHSDGLGRGSEFTVVLPLIPSAQSGGAVAAAAGPALGRALRILVIEDNDDGRDMLKIGLELVGHRVEAVADGPSGIAAAGITRPDVVIVDIGLPGMDGFAVARSLREQFGASLRLVALTGYGRVSDRERARDAGFDAHLTKPATAEDVLSVLQR